METINNMAIFPLTTNESVPRLQEVTIPLVLALLYSQASELTKKAMTILTARPMSASSVKTVGRSRGTSHTKQPKAEQSRETQLLARHLSMLPTGADVLAGSLRCHSEPLLQDIQTAKLP